MASSLSSRIARGGSAWLGSTGARRYSAPPRHRALELQIDDGDQVGPPLRRAGTRVLQAVEPGQVGMTGASLLHGVVDVERVVAVARSRPGESHQGRFAVGEPPHPLRVVRQDPGVSGQRIDCVVQLRVRTAACSRHHQGRDRGSARRTQRLGTSTSPAAPARRQRATRRCTDRSNMTRRSRSTGISIGDITRSSMSLAVTRRATIGTTSDVSAKCRHAEIECDGLATLQCQHGERHDGHDDGDADALWHASDQPSPTTMWPVPMNASRMVRERGSFAAAFESWAQRLAGLDEVADDPHRADADRTAPKGSETSTATSRPPLATPIHDHHSAGRDQPTPAYRVRKPSPARSPPIAAVRVDSGRARQHHEGRQRDGRVRRLAPHHRCHPHEAMAGAERECTGQAPRPGEPADAAAAPSGRCRPRSTPPRRSSPTSGCDRRVRAGAETSTRN